MLRHAILEQQIFKTKVAAQEELGKSAEKELAKELTVAIDTEKVKRVAEQVKRRAEVE